MIAARLAICAALLALAACATPSAVDFAPVNEAQRARALAQLAAYEGFVAVGPVALAPGVDPTPQCRGVGPIDPSRGLTLPEFVRAAFVRELTQAGRYAPEAEAALSVVVTEVTMVSMSDANWTLAITISSPNSSGYSVWSSTPFPHVFEAGSACSVAGDAFNVALRALIDQTFAHPQFPELLAPP